jgi:hypothetical protein
MSPQKAKIQKRQRIEKIKENETTQCTRASRSLRSSHVLMTHSETQLTVVSVQRPWCGKHSDERQDEHATNTKFKRDIRIRNRMRARGNQSEVHVKQIERKQIQDTIQMDQTIYIMGPLRLPHEKEGAPVTDCKCVHGNIINTKIPLVDTASTERYVWSCLQNNTRLPRNFQKPVNQPNRTNPKPNVESPPNHINTTRKAGGDLGMPLVATRTTDTHKRTSEAKVASTKAHNPTVGQTDRAKMTDVGKTQC